MAADIGSQCPVRLVVCQGGWGRVQGSLEVGIGGELRAGSTGSEGILPSCEGGTSSISGCSRRADGRFGETHTLNGNVCIGLWLGCLRYRGSSVDS